MPFALALLGALAAAALLPSKGAEASESALVFTPAADARVEALYPDTNHGSGKGLLVDAQPGKESYLRFTVSRTSGAVESAKLRLYVYEGSTDGPTVYTTDSGWSESGITWNDRPGATSDEPLDDAGAGAAGTWVELDVTDAVTGDGTYSFLLRPSSGDGMDMYSREAVREGGPPPELVVAAGSETADTAPPTVAITSPESGTRFTVAQTVTLAASASDDVGVAKVEFHRDGALAGTDTDAPFSLSWPITAANNGTHTWTAKAYDAAGNAGASAPLDLIVDIADAIEDAAITASVETDPVPHSGDAADDAAVWVAEDPASSTVIGTDKQGGLAVYDLSGRELHYYAGGRPNGVDLRQGFPLEGERRALVAASDRANNTIALFAVDAATRGLDRLAPAIPADMGVYGLCMYRSAQSGKFYVFVTSKSGEVGQWELAVDGEGGVSAERVRTLTLGSVTEGCVADDELGHLYVAEEDVGIWKYGAEPDAGAERTKVDAVGDGRLVADVEGLAIYDGGGGAGYLLASSQGSDSFAVYGRGGDNAYAGRFRVEAGAIDAVTDTDGIEVASAALGGAFPAGVFVAQDGTNDEANQNFKLVPWGPIAADLADEAQSEDCDRPYAESSPWNTPLGPAPTYHPESDFHVGALEGALTSDPTQYTYPVYEVTTATTLQVVTISGWFSNVVDESTLLNQRGGFVLLPIPEGAAPAAGSDAQIIMVDAVTGDEWGASNLERDELGNWTAWNAYHYNTAWSAVPPRDDSDRPFFPRGAGVPYLAGLVRPCEIARGRIDHALAFAYDYPTAEYVYPATKSDGAGTDPRDVPEGTRFQLDPTLSQDEIRAWGCTGPCLTIARALQEYGMYVIDNSGRPKVMMEYEGTADWDGVVTSKTVSSIPLSAFKVVVPGGGSAG